MAIALVQSKQGAAASASSVGATYDSALTAGTLLIATVWSFDNSTISISDTASHTWTPVASQQVTSNSTMGTRTYTAPNSGTATPTVTGTTASGDYLGIVISEWSGVDGTTPLDGVTPVTNSGTMNSSGTVTAGAITPNSNNAVLYGVLCQNYTGANPSYTITNGTTLQQRTTWSTDIAFATGYEPQTTAASESVTWSVSGVGSDEDWTSLVFVLKEAATGDATATPSTVAAVAAVPAPTASISNPYVVQSKTGSATTASPAVTFDNVPLENDIVILFCSRTVTAQTLTIPTGWENPLGGTTDVESDAHQVCMVGHRVTAAEESGSTVTFTATSLYGSSAATGVIGFVVRNIDTTTMFDVASSDFNSGNTSTTSALPGLTPTVTGGIMVAGVAADAAARTYTEPAGWSVITNQTTTSGSWTGSYDTFTTASTPISATSITQSAGDEWAAISVVLPVASSGDATATPSTVACTTSVPSPTAGAGVTVSAGVVAAVVAVPSPTAAGNVAVTADVVSALASVPSPTASSGSTVTADVVAGLVTLPPPTVQTGSDVEATPSTVAAVVAVPSPTAAGNVAVTADVVATVAAVPTPTAGAGVGVTPSTVAAVVAVPAPTATASTDATATPAVVAATVSVPSPVAATGLWPTSIDATNKRILDQNGDPWFGVGDTAWSLVGQLSQADITTYMEAIAAKGVNFVLFNAPEPYFTDNTPADRNQAGADPFTGTRFQSSINDTYWQTVDHAITEAARLGITCLICPQYIGYNDTEGYGNELTDAYTANTANLTTYGQELAARYPSATYPNIVWLIGHDRPSMTSTHKAASKLIADELPAAHLLALGGDENDTYGDTTWSGSGITSDFNTVYDYDNAAGADTATAWSSKTVIFFEGKYEQEQSIAVGGQLLREQLWAPLMEGASATIFGNNPRWHFESGKELYGFSGTWQNSLTNATYNEGTVHLSYLSTFLADNPDVLATLPDTTDTFRTAGTGAVARFDTTVGVCYAPGTGSITLDTTELAGTTNVRIRRFDPTDGSYTTVASSEAQSSSRAISYPGTNANGDTDWVYIVDLTGGATATPSTVAAVAAVPSPTAGAGVGVAADVVAAVAAVPSPTAGAGAGASPSTVATVVAIGSPTVATGAGATPSTVAVVGDVPSPGVSAAGNATATPTTVAAVVAVGSPTVATGATASPAAVAAVVAVGSPTVATGATASPSTIAATSSVQTPSITAGEVDPGAVVYVVPAETRVWVIPAETRTLVVRAETRKLVVPDGL